MPTVLQSAAFPFPERTRLLIMMKNRLTVFVIRYDEKMPSLRSDSMILSEIPDRRPRRRKTGYS